jgi:hypothetical protein
MHPIGSARDPLLGIVAGGRRLPPSITEGSDPSSRSPRGSRAIRRTNLGLRLSFLANYIQRMVIREDEDEDA